jgi:hypothetical protein
VGEADTVLAQVGLGLGRIKLDRHTPLCILYAYIQASGEAGVFQVANRKRLSAAEPT